MSIGLTCGHLTRGVCAKCVAQTQKLSQQHERQHAFSEGVAAERARVVAWLRCESRAAPVKGREFNSMCRLADAIERGEHEEGT